MTGTFTTLTSNPKFPTKITQAVAAVADRFPYMVVSNALANAYVHKNAIPQSLLGMLTLTRIIINYFSERIIDLTARCHSHTANTHFFCLSALLLFLLRTPNLFRS